VNARTRAGAIRVLRQLLLTAALLLVHGKTLAGPDPTTWDALLKSCVHTLPRGGGTAVDYRCFQDRRAELDSYLGTLSAVTRPEYDGWSDPEQLAFLINAYNAFTVALILGAYPDLESIRDLGGLFSSPWKKAFVPLLGETISLDDIEHGMIRESGHFDEPRIHFAVNCASVGCPALRREAYRGAALESQLEAQTQQFLGDRSRNRLRGGVLEVTPLFRWYREDFAAGWRGADSLRAFLARYADSLALNGAQREQLLRGDLEIAYRDYDWSLNDWHPGAAD
jgi:hypothetical protein